MRDDVVPLYPLTEQAERIEWDTFEEISEEFIKQMSAAVKSDDVWESIRVVARTQKLMRLYISIGDDRWLPPLERQLRNTLYKAFRMARRVSIRKALTCREGDETPFDAQLKSDKRAGPDVDEDYAAVERHLNEGRRLFEGLWRGRKDRARLG